MTHILFAIALAVLVLIVILLAIAIAILRDRMNDVERRALTATVDDSLVALSYLDGRHVISIAGHSTLRQSTINPHS